MGVEAFVPKSRKKPVNKGGRPRILGPASLPTPAQSVPPSLPPVAPETGASASSVPEKKPGWYLPPDSKVRTIAMQIIAMRIAGMADDEIATTLQISRKSISPYIYRATKNGWLDLDDPKDRLQFQLMHKVVANLAEGLDSPNTLQTGMRERTAVALKVAEGTVFKQFQEQNAPQLQQTIVAIRVEMPEGGLQQIREDTTGGEPAYVEAQKL